MVKFKSLSSPKLMVGYGRIRAQFEGGYLITDNEELIKLLKTYPEVVVVEETDDKPKLKRAP